VQRVVDVEQLHLARAVEEEVRAGRQQRLDSVMHPVEVCGDVFHGVHEPAVGAQAQVTLHCVKRDQVGDVESTLAKMGVVSAWKSGGKRRLEVSVHASQLTSYGSPSFAGSKFTTAHLRPGGRADELPCA